MNVNFKQLKAFVSVYETGKLGLAAERLFLTQSAISVLIRQLETEIGEKLFERTTRALRPTAAAADLLPIAQRVLREIDSIDSHFRRFSSGSRGRVTLAVTPAMAVSVIPHAVREFSESHPEVQVVVDDCAPDQFVPRILSGQVEFGVGSPDRVTSAIECETLVTDHLCAVLREEEQLAALGSIPWRALVDFPIIAVKPGYGIRPLIDAALLQAGVSLRIAYEFTYLNTALAFAAERLGIAILPSSMINRLKYTPLVARRLVGPVAPREVCIVKARGNSLSPAAQSFAALVRAALAEGRPGLSEAM